MAQFIAFHPENETRGAAFLGITQVLGELHASKLLAKHGLEDIDPQAWYPQQTELNMLRDINTMMDFVAIGMRIPEVVGYGVDVTTIEQAFNLLDAGYKHNHRGPNIGGFQHKWTSKRSIRMICHTPYPSDMDYGIIYRLVQKYHPQGKSSFSVLRDFTAPNRKYGDDTCTFNIAW